MWESPGQNWSLEESHVSQVQSDLMSMLCSGVGREQPVESVDSANPAMDFRAQQLGTLVDYISSS